MRDDLPAVPSDAHAGPSAGLPRDDTDAATGAAQAGDLHDKQADPRAGTGADRGAGPGSTRGYGVLRTARLRIAIPLENLIEVSTIARLSPVLAACPGLLGSLDLRGHLVPIYDLDSLAAGSPATPEVPPRYAAIIRVAEHQIGLGIAQTDGLLHFDAAALQPIDIAATTRVPQTGPPRASATHGTAGPSDDPFAMIAGNYMHDGEVVTVLDPQALFARRGLSLARRPPALPRERTTGPGEPQRVASRGGDHAAATPPAAAARPQARTRFPLLAFVAGGATLGLRAHDIHATVPRCRIEPNALTAGACIGSITHHGQRVPVLRTTDIAGIGTAHDRADPEIVVLRCEGERRIGLAVDTIIRMMACDPAALAPAPPAILGAHGVVTGVIAPSGSDEQVFVLDAEKVRGLALVKDLAGLSGATGPDRSERTAARRPAHGDLVPEQVRHLIFDAGLPVATPIRQILHIIRPPERLVPSAANGRPGVRGVFSVDGIAALYVDLAEVLGLRQDRGACARVLLVGDGPHRVGFAVGSVDGIETSEWRRSEARGGSTIVQLGRGPGRRILPAIDLQRLAAPFFA